MGEIQDVRPKHISIELDEEPEPEMPRRALLIGIDEYDHLEPLKACVADAKAMGDLLARNEDDSPNYDCRVVTSKETKINRKALRQEWRRLFNNFRGDILFYFSGHGAPTEVGGFLVTQEGETDDPGLSMNDLLVMANSSRAEHVLLILDCCHSGDLGNPPSLQGQGGVHQAQLREGLTILAASRATEAALEVEGHGVFTWLLLGGLRGGAADVRGYVSAASLYAYVDQALGPWEQRPMYKSHAEQLPPVRRCDAAVPDSLLRTLSTVFAAADRPVQLNPSYEPTHKSAKPENVALFKSFKKLRDARLLLTEDGNDLYYTALHSGRVRLTPLGRYYWHLASQRRI